MSAWQLGREGATPRFAAFDAETDTPLQTFVGRVLTWIPLDVVAIYAAAITALTDEPNDSVSKWLIVGGVSLALVAVPLGAFATKTSEWFTKKVKVRMALAPIAFLIWSPTVPDSGWNNVKFVVDNPAWTVVICAVAGYLFSLIAQGLDKRVEA